MVDKVSYEMKFDSAGIPDMDAVVSSAIRMVMHEKKFNAIVTGNTKFSKEYVRKFVDPQWKKVVKARSDLKAAVENLNRKK